MCSTRSEQQPTVSADSSASFSLPARNASCREGGRERGREGRRAVEGNEEIGGETELSGCGQKTQLVHFSSHKQNSHKWLPYQ